METTFEGREFVAGQSFPSRHSCNVRSRHGPLGMDPGPERTTSIRQSQT